MSASAPVRIEDDSVSPSLAATHQDQDLWSIANVNDPLGGTSGPAFCLLDGFFQDPQDQTRRVTLPIDRFPAIIGRATNPSDPHFFGVGNAIRSISRQQCRIEYRTKNGWLRQLDPKSKDFTYTEDKETKVLHTKDQKPPDSCFTITCLGKNKITVNGRQIENGETAYLSHGSALKISAYMVYFLLPNNPPKVTMDIGPKRKNAPAPSSSPAAKVQKTSSDGLPASKELVDLTVEQLMQCMEKAASMEGWGRQQSSIGTQLCLRACQACPLDPEMQILVGQHGGLTKHEILQWMESDSVFGRWYELFRQKVEKASVVANVTSCLQKAGFVRDNGKGMNVRWIPPTSIVDVDKVKAQYGVQEVQEEAAQQDESMEEDVEEDEKGGQSAEAAIDIE